MGAPRWGALQVPITGGVYMKLEIVEGSCTPEEPVQSIGSLTLEPSGCSEGGFIIGCCIIHFWCWEPGHGLCC